MICPVVLFFNRIHHNSFFKEMTFEIGVTEI
jgi:hypothetical protein